VTQVEAKQASRQPEDEVRASASERFSDDNTSIYSAPEGTVVISRYGLVMKKLNVLLTILSLGTLSVNLVGCSSTPVSAACDQMMTAAANEPYEVETSLIGTLTSCTTAAEWVAAIIAHPNAGVLTHYDEAEAHKSLDSYCYAYIHTPTCMDASQKGILSYSPDDPNVVKSQK
jgi:hypothetical protein